ncbi:hypothetical protein [Laspinema olomoucense]|uniref:hypothetical protein n=1 Tax=Laspinema olomoucense TaxID=3231600 RepID=UPI0021BBA072|nr:hypothetical protein [Laspinema sp. D3c]MCT7995747.1 hypothetical protein [Laspinema sp. D3c]
MTEFLELALIAQLHRVSHIPEAEIYVLGHHRRQEGGEMSPCDRPLGLIVSMATFFLLFNASFSHRCKLRMT